ncbi:LysR family transcriptional regulator [Neisseria sp. 83E34]|uniref:LysR family transcriptional regulator n=1 Tax=Neisseria sp. 83E34 TaxID=1692264 RepID=UPI0006CE7AC6|nr:LysR family transcriptional regulator [Neisseria sp. 83E34]KPN70734.1 transcriptional regulator [Neisseria sp. 83E34]
MDINHLKSFVAVAYHCNLTQAAERLFLSQPAVSAQIKAIETYLGTPLFNRTSNGMSLTRAGEIFLPEAESLLQHKHRLDNFAKTLAEHYTQDAQIGLIHPISSKRVSKLTRLLNDSAPDIQLHIQYGMSGEILERILSKQLHGGFFLGPVNTRSVRSIFLENIQYSLICPTAEVENIRNNLPKNLENYIWIEMSGVSASNKHLQQFWRANRLSPKRQIICDYPQTIVDLVSDGIGVAMVPSHKAQDAINAGKPVSVIEEFRQTLPLNFIYLDEYEHDPALVLIKQSVENVWQLKNQPEGT